jgi:16S rRNA processing protein RimM
LLLRPALHGGPAEGLPFGTFGRPHGTRGEINFHPFHSRGWRLETVALPLAVSVGAPGAETAATIVNLRPIADGYLIRLDGFSSREAVAQLTGQKLWLPRKTLPPLAADEFYVGDLLGCSVENGEGQVLGVVRAIFWNGAHDVMVMGEGEDERLLPVVPEYIVTIDRLARRVVVNPHE